ncbi:MAG: MIP family channel protein [Phycisphaerae bacterium]|nr:MIP family channel protein [Phycisphaerae bacterium]
MKRRTWLSESLAEMAGTFLLVFFGVGVVHASILTGAQSGVWQVAVVWGGAVALAIYSVGAVSGAHINPAMTVAFAVHRGFPWGKVPYYILSQLAGAILAAIVLYGLFQGPLGAFEAAHSIVRGQPGSELSAMVYGEYFPNPGIAEALGWAADCVSELQAFGGEMIGTALLAVFVFALTDKRNSVPHGGIAALIGLTIAILISVIAPLTQAGFNPARDFGPRLVAFFAGWGSIAIPGPRGGFFTVYILAPVVGAVVGAGMYEFVIGHGLCPQEERFSEKGAAMKPVRLIFVGGFLGAGKTTLLYSAARELIASGKRVGLITNDQAPDLVDTRMLQSRNLSVREVAGSCFCCNFNGLIKAARALGEGTASVDVLLAEPVGSCTDLSATIVQPVKDRHGDVFSVAPLTVLVDPVRAVEVLSGGSCLLHPSAAYIYRKQIEEADRIVVNKSDLLSDGQKRQLHKLLETEFPGRTVAFISCHNGEGIKEWLGDVLTETKAGRRILDLDYDTYAEGEAVLGWLNGYFGLSSEIRIDWADFAARYLKALQAECDRRKVAVGHIKLFLSTQTGTLTGNLTSVRGPVVIQRQGDLPSGTEAEMTLNARVQMDPERLQEICLDLLRDLDGQISVQVLNLRSLRPGRPNPTYRYSGTV